MHSELGAGQAGVRIVSWLLCKGQMGQAGTNSGVVRGLQLAERTHVCT